jgi:hypothetical protein
MLEIKCPLMRKIKYKGDIIDTICPIYYWCQVQLQLECCDLDECDFVQCNIEEYINRTDWLNDTNSEYDYKSSKYNLERGVLLEILPAKLEDDDYKNGIITENVIYDKATFVYPPKIDMTNDEIDKWILNELEILETKKIYRLNRIVYWRLIERNCTLIKRDKKWFEDNLEKLRTMWGYVEFLRKNEEITKEWKDWIDNLDKKYNEKIITKLKELITNKINSSNLITNDENINKETVNEEIINKKETVDKEEIDKENKIKKISKKISKVASKKEI